MFWEGGVIAMVRKGRTEIGSRCDNILVVVCRTELCATQKC
jgi:hypothetical protein